MTQLHRYLWWLAYGCLLMLHAVLCITFGTQGFDALRFLAQAVVSLTATCNAQALSPAAASLTGMYAAGVSLTTYCLLSSRFLIVLPSGVQ